MQGFFIILILFSFIIAAWLFTNPEVLGKKMDTKAFWSAEVAVVEHLHWRPLLSLWSLRTSLRAHGSFCLCCPLCNHKRIAAVVWLLVVRRLADELHMPSLPEMMFGDNVLRIQHGSGFGIEFNATDALRCVNNYQGMLKVACAEEWQESRWGSGRVWVTWERTVERNFLHDVCLLLEWKASIVIILDSWVILGFICLTRKVEILNTWWVQLNYSGAELVRLHFWTWGVLSTPCTLLFLFLKKNSYLWFAL